MVLEIAEEVRLEGGVLGVVGLNHCSEEPGHLLGPGRESEGLACDRDDDERTSASESEERERKGED